MIARKLDAVIKKLSNAKQTQQINNFTAEHITQQN